MRLRVAEIQRIHHHTDVRRVLSRLPHMRDLDQFKRGFMHGPLEVLVTTPVAVGLLDHDVALEQQTLNDFLDVKLRVVRIPHAQGDVLKIAEHRHAFCLNVLRHKKESSLQSSRQRLTRPDPEPPMRAATSSSVV